MLDFALLVLSKLIGFALFVLILVMSIRYRAYWWNRKREKRVAADKETVRRFSRR